MNSLQKVLAELIADDVREDFQAPAKNGEPDFTGSSCSIRGFDIHSRAQLVGGVVVGFRRRKPMTCFVR